MTPTPIWLDCDPGHDDATAILLAGHTPGLRLLGISTIGGNQTLAKVTQNALDVLDSVGLSHIDVVAGQPRPLMRPPMLCPEIHGDSGLDGPSGGRLLPRSPRRPLPGKAVNVMYEAIRAAYEELQRDTATGAQARSAVGAAKADGVETAVEAAAEAAGPCAGGVDGPGRGCGTAQQQRLPGPSRVRLVCTGALTNAALLLTLYPEVAGMVELAIMGGCMGIGNTGPVVEFNIQTDPEAAKIVFESGVDLTMVPLEVTHTVLVTPGVLAAIGGATTQDATAGPAAAHGAAHPHPAEGCPAAASNTAAAAAATPAATAASLAAEALSALAVDAVAAAAAVPAAATSHAAAVAVAVTAASPFRQAWQQLLLFFAETYRRVFHFQHPPLHDPVAVAWLIRPELFETRLMRVDVETASPLSAGQTVCDVWGTSGRPANVRVALRVDVPGFWRLLLEAVGRADAVSPLNRKDS